MPTGNLKSKILNKRDIQIKHLKNKINLLEQKVQKLESDNCVCGMSNKVGPGTYEGRNSWEKDF